MHTIDHGMKPVNHPFGKLHSDRGKLYQNHGKPQKKRPGTTRLFMPHDAFPLFFPFHDILPESYKILYGHILMFLSFLKDFIDFLCLS